MHLLDASTLQLSWFPGKPPPYAILSHTWGSDEVTFADIADLSGAKARAGFHKIEKTCKQAVRDGLGYAWVDTCCINKESSAELSEAINSMFRWYRNAAICYAYLEDLSETLEAPPTKASVLKECRWFSRGWTLQELVAPREIIFYRASWVTVGRKSELQEVLEQITAIPGKVLAQVTSLDRVSVADRMNWAARRQTTREEDIAYCLMGIFDVNMPMMYGEGRKAFIRLQEEIAKQTQDDSLFAWRASPQSAVEAPYRGLFASSPAEFASDDTITPFYTDVAGATTILGNGRISLSCVLYQDGVLGLKCSRGTDVSSVVGIEVVRTGSRHFLRSNPSNLTLKAHKYPPDFTDVVFEKFAEMREPGLLDDIYRRDCIQLAQLPPEISLITIYPKEYQDFRVTGTVPTVYTIGKGIGFELHVDGDGSGVKPFQQIGWDDKSDLTTQWNTRLLLSVWVEQRLGTRSYSYCCDLRRIGSGESKVFPAKRPPAGLECQDLVVAWSTIQVQGTCEKVDGNEKYILGLTLTVDENIRAAVETEENAIKEKREAEQAAARERSEIDEEASKDVEERKKRAKAVRDSVKNSREERRWLTITLTLFIVFLTLLSVSASMFRTYESQSGPGGLGTLFGIVFGIILTFISGVAFCVIWIDRRSRLKQELRTPSITDVS